MEKYAALRYEEPGYRPVAMHDPAKRRGLWVNVVAVAGEDAMHPGLPTKIELCSGREGSDAYVSVALGDVISQRQLYDLGEVFSTAAWAYDLALAEPDSVEHLARKVCAQAEEIASLIQSLAVYKEECEKLQEKLSKARG